MKKEVKKDKDGTLSFLKDKFNTLKLKEIKVKSINSFLSNKVGIDLGTATIVVYLDGKGVILSEPTLLAINKRTDQVVSVGKKARVMIGRTPEHMEVIQPIQEGVVYNYEVTEQLFEYVFRKIQDEAPKALGPSVIIGIPCKTSQTEINAIRDAVYDAGARSVDIVYEPLAAAIGMELLLFQNKATMVIDIGGGTTDLMILSGGEIVKCDSVRIAGNKFDEDILEGLKNNKQLSVGIRTAEDLKIAIMQSAGNRKVFSVQGRSIQSGLPLEVEVNLEEILGYIEKNTDKILKHTTQFIETSSSEVLADLKNDNIYLVGGGSMIYNFADSIEARLNLKVKVPKNSTTVVAKGTAIIAKNPEKYKRYFL